MRRRMLWAYSLLVIFSLLAHSFPTAPVRAQDDLAPAADTVSPLAEPADPELVQATEPPQPPELRPSLTLRLVVAPTSWVTVGEIITSTITVFNQSPAPADDLVLSLPIPVDVAPADLADPSLTPDGWRWFVGTLSGNDQVTVTATMRLTQVPIGEALLLEPSATAAGLDLPVMTRGGALVSTTVAAPDSDQVALTSEEAVSDRQSRTLGAPTEPITRTVRFTPGQATQLHSRDGRITMTMPADAFDRPLTLVERTLDEQRPFLRAQNLPEPPPIAGARPGFGAFFLEAMDDEGRDIATFRAPLEIRVRFTPQQLQALGIAPEDLTIFWFDERWVGDAERGRPQQGRWVPKPTTVDVEQGIATTRVDHFSGFQLSDGSSPSAAYLPSLKGWQVSSFTGAASFRFPIDVPAGPGGIRPDLTLQYSSAATDGAPGMRPTQQSSWVGKGWSLDTGAVTLNKIEVSSSTIINQYAMSVGGRSFNLVRAEPLVGQPNPENPTHWAWRPTDESFIRARITTNGSSTPGSPGNPGRGASDYGVPYTRYLWTLWDTSGTRYEFAEDLWWAWAKCGGGGDFAYFESNRWLLSSVTDPSGNRITYTYDRAHEYFATCLQQAGTVDYDVWPSTIRWGRNINVPGSQDRFRVEFQSTPRTNDTQFDWPAFVVGGPVRQTRQLNAIRVLSNSSNPYGDVASNWQLIREYRFSYDYSLRSDERFCTGSPCTWGPNNAYPKLTLTAIREFGNNATNHLPITTFSYNTTGGTAFDANGGWNRLTGMNNGQGGTLSLTYANIAVATPGADHFRNRHRVTARTVTDGRGNSYPWTYTYTLPQVNSIGTNLGDGIATSAHPSSATLYYNVFLDGDADYSDERWLVDRTWTSFLGHASVTETDPTGTQTIRFFHQGNAGCTPPVSARGSHTAIVGDSCFQQMLVSEQLKGREWKTEVRAAGNALLQETVRSFDVDLLDYSWQPLTGLWRSFSYEYRVDETMWDGGTTASTRRTETYYNGSCTLNAVDANGNPRCVLEYDRGTLIRKTVHAYGTRVTAGEYIVDRNIATSIYDSANRYLAHSQRFYDGNNQSLGTIGTRGLLTRELQSSNVPLQTSVTNVTLSGRDTTTTYNAFGNPTEQRSYAGAGWVLWNGSAWSASTPGNGSAARLTSTSYESLFNTYPTAITNPLNQTQTATYDYRMGTLTSVTDANAQTTSAEYDIYGRMVKLIRPGDTSTHPTILAIYDDYAQPFRYRVEQREVAGQSGVIVTQQFYDGLGRQIQIKHESSSSTQLQTIVTDTRYDGLDRVIQESQPRLVNETSTSFTSYTSVPGSGMRWTNTTYDGLGRPVQITAPDNSVTMHRYGVDSATGLRWHDVTDARRHRTQFRTDTLGRLVNVLELSGNCGNYWGYTCSGAFTVTWAVAGTATYAYHALDLLRQVIDASGNTTTMSYDSLGRKTAMSDPNMGSWSYAYDANGNLTRQTDAKGQRICFYYDGLDRLTGKHYRTDNSCPGTPTSGQLAQTYSYDQGTNGIGRRTGMNVNGGAGTTWGYDTRGRVSSATHTVPGLSGSRAFSWQYNSADQLTQITYPSVGGSAEVVRTTYDSSGRPTSVCINGGGCYAQSLTYNALNQPTSRRHGNNAFQRWTYDAPLSRLDRIQVGTETSAGSFFDRSYDYDAVGNITLIADNTSPGIPDQTYAYDHRDRLTRWTLGTTTQNYTYDLIGNLTNKAGTSLTYGSNANGTGVGPHQARSVGGQAYTYDANGNLTGGGGRTLTWTYENKPASITSGGVAESYAYDADGARVTRTRSGTTTVYLEGLWEEVIGGSTTKYYTLGDAPVALRTHTGSSSSVSHLHGDHLGSMSLTTAGSTTPTLQSQQEFDPWGAIRAGGVAQTRRGFTGQYLDQAGLLFYNARYYDPATGRFISADVLVPGDNGMEGIAFKPLTVGFANPSFLASLNEENRQRFWFQLAPAQQADIGKPWGPSNPQALNRYAYVLNNPLKYTDPTGHCPGRFAPLCGAAKAAQKYASAAAKWITSKLRGPAKTNGTPSSTASAATKSVPWKHLDAKKVRQAANRGWSNNDIQSVLDNPAQTKATTYKGTGDPATVYYRSDGHYVVRNDKTGEVFHVSNRNDPKWVDPFGDPIRPR